MTKFVSSFRLPGICIDSYLILFYIASKNDLTIATVLSNLKHYHRPRTISEALALLQKNSGTISIIAGGTKIVPSDDDTVRELVDVSALNLNYVKEEIGLIRVGATTPLQRFIENPVIKMLYGGMLYHATLLTQQSRMLRNVSTIGGELVTTHPLSVLYCALITLQSQVRIAGGEEFALAMNIFLNKKSVEGGLLMEILVPCLKHQTYAGMSFISSTRKSNPIICACVRLSLQGGKCKDVKISLTGCEKVPKRFHSAEIVLDGRELNNTSIELAADAVYKNYTPISDTLASSEFRKEVCRIVVKNALVKCLDSAETDLIL